MQVVQSFAISQTSSQLGLSEPSNYSGHSMVPWSIKSAHFNSHKYPMKNYTVRLCITKGDFIISMSHMRT